MNPHAIDNVPRAERLQQLITHIGVIQSDISNEQKRMEDLDSVCRTKLEELLKAGKVQSLDKLKEEAMSKLPDDEKRVFNGVSCAHWAAQVHSPLLVNRRSNRPDTECAVGRTSWMRDQN